MHPPTSEKNKYGDVRLYGSLVIAAEVIYQFYFIWSSGSTINNQNKLFNNIFYLYRHFHSVFIHFILYCFLLL